MLESIYSQIGTCNTCQGWGYSKFPTDNPYDKCSKCKGVGVYLPQTNRLIYWGMPTFVDYKQRRHIKISKIVIVSLLILSAIALLSGFIGAISFLGGVN